MWVFLRERKKVLEGFESAIFPINQNEGTGLSDFDRSYLKILAPKQMLQSNRSYLDMANLLT